MKFTNWQIIAVVAVLFAAIIASNIWAPGVASTVIAMATTLFAALGITRKSDDAQQ